MLPSEFPLYFACHLLQTLKFTALPCHFPCQTSIIRYDFQRLKRLLSGRERIFFRRVLPDSAYTRLRQKIEVTAIIPLAMITINQPTGPEELSDVLAKLFAARGWGRKSERIKLEEAWGKTIGPEFGPDTRVNSLRRGILEVEVRNPILMQELSQFHRKRLIAAVAANLPGQSVKDIRFRAGVWA
jgi:Dna[CI] antecedent, DciA